MWSRLTALTEDEYQHLSQFPGDDDTLELAETIRLVSNRPYADELAVVTSMWSLRLTSAKRYGDRHQHWHHPGISILLTDERKISLNYNPGGAGKVESTAWKTVSTPEEAATYIDLLMNRMPYDTETVEEAIRDAKQRKRAYERARTEQGGAPDA